MSLWLQHTLVLALVAGCLVFVTWQGWRALLGKRSKLGSCCAKGCAQAPASKPGGGEGGRRIVFLPAEMLRKKR